MLSNPSLKDLHLTRSEHRILKYALHLAKRSLHHVLYFDDHDMDEPADDADGEQRCRQRAIINARLKNALKIIFHDRQKWLACGIAKVNAKTADKIQQAYDDVFSAVYPQTHFDLASRALDANSSVLMDKYLDAIGLEDLGATDSDLLSDAEGAFDDFLVFKTTDDNIR